jgi:hypothetical protein
MGIALGVAILASITAAWIAVPLWIIAILLLAWGLQPKLLEQFVDNRCWRRSDRELRGRDRQLFRWPWGSQKGVALGPYR